MRVLILGATGMLGHRLWLTFSPSHETWGTIRGSARDHSWSQLFDPARLIEGVSSGDPESLRRAMAEARPELVVNAIGVVKQLPAGSDPGAAYLANCFVPHFMRKLCDSAGARLIQLSTDCVFSGERGHYSEADQPDATDVYGLTKRLGEIGAPHLTVRTSMIGRSLSGTAGLLEWLLAQHGRVRGYRRAVFSGLSTEYTARTILAIAEDYPNLDGLWHVAASPISKYDLLVRLAVALKQDVDIVPVDEPVIDRSLDDTRLRTTTTIERPTWDEMIAELAADPTPYPELRGERA